MITKKFHFYVSPVIYLFFQQTGHFVSSKTSKLVILVAGKNIIFHMDNIVIFIYFLIICPITFK